MYNIFESLNRCMNNMQINKKKTQKQITKVYHASKNTYQDLK